MIIGAQFYTLREQCKNLDDFAKTLKKVADIGYTTVQISGTCAYEPEWLRDELKKNGLSCVLTHIHYDRLRDNIGDVIADHDTFGCRYVGLGVGPDHLTNGGMEKMLDLAHTSGQALHRAGKQLMYHNHAMEFTHDAPDGGTRYRYLIDHTAPEELGFTLDTYWVQAGGGCVTDWIEALRGRIPCVHLKDLTMNDWEQHMAPVGAGNLNWDKILPAIEAAGAEYALVEQDETYGEDPFACLKQSYDFLRAQGLA